MAWHKNCVKKLKKANSTSRLVVCLTIKFSRIDYSGIVLGLVGSFLPWIYYLFYCSLVSQIVYTVVTCLLGSTCFYVSMWDTFAEAKFRHIRAGRHIYMCLVFWAINVCLVFKVFKQVYNTKQAMHVHQQHLRMLVSDARHWRASLTCFTDVRHWRASYWRASHWRASHWLASHWRVSHWRTSLNRR